MLSLSSILYMILNEKKATGYFLILDNLATLNFRVITGSLAVTLYGGQEGDSFRQISVRLKSTAGKTLLRVAANRSFL